MTDVLNEPAQIGAPPGTTQTIEQLWRKRLNAGLYYRRPFELSWLMDLAFASGQQWSVIDRHSRSLRDISEVDPRYQGADLYVADFIKEQRGAALGELTSDSERPELLVPEGQAGDPVTDEIQAQLNQALGHAWDREVDGDSLIQDARRKCIDLGVSAIRCRWDKTAGRELKTSGGGPVTAPVGDDGRPITDHAKAREYVAGKQQAGETAKFTGPLSEGRTKWEVGSGFNLIVPPGVAHERDFPWEGWVRPVPIDDVRALWPAQTKDLQPDADIGSTIGITVAQGSFNVQQGGYLPQRLADHVWMFNGFERPSPRYPRGRVAILIGGKRQLVEVDDKLPYQLVNGDWHSGIVYFHWWRLTDRFYSVGLVESLRDPQRMTNRTATQQQEIVDRSMPFILTEEGAYVEKPSGKPMEWVEVKKGTQVQPQAIQGPGPGLWMQQHRQQLLEDAQHASTISSLKLGENPTNVDTYSQLALLQDQEASKRSVIRSDQQKQVDLLAELTVSDMRYWSDGKQILVAGGKQNELRVTEFRKSTVPPLWLVAPSKGSAKPRSQASQLQLIQDIWNAAVAATVVQQDPLAWVQWLKSSYEAGEPLALPSPAADNQILKARRENHDLATVGVVPAVAYWDDISVHLPIHREAEDEAILAGDIETLTRTEEHIKEHQDVAAQNAAQLAQVRPPAPALPGAPPAPGLPAPPPAGAPPAPPQP